MLRFASAFRRSRAGFRFASAFRRLAAGCLAVAVLGCAGCGGEDSDESEFSPVVSDSLSKVEFLRQADEICLASESQIEAAADDLVTSEEPPDPAEVERVAVDIVVPSLESEVAALRALGAPEGDEERVEAILSATEEGIAAIEDDPRGLLDGIPKPLAEAQKLAEQYGSRQCGIPGST